MRTLPVLSLCSIAAAQLYNGQYFTRGLSIIDAPNPGSPYHAGSNMPIAVDVSGNGQLSAHADSSIRNLTIFLVSAQTNTNFSVVANATFLSGEEGSTVKHLDFNVSDCVPAGSYNLTFYEVSEYQGKPYFSITPLPVEIQSSTKDTTACTTDKSTAPEPQPQPDSALGTSPFLPGSASPPNGAFRQEIGYLAVFLSLFACIFL